MPRTITGSPARGLACFLVLALLAIWAGGGALAGPQPQVIGEHLWDTVLETPHPYPGGDGSTPRVVWSDHFHYPKAAYLVFEFAQFDLAPGDWVEVRDPASKQVHVYRGKGFKDKGGDFITKMILGPEAYIDLYSVDPSGESYGYRIGRITRGFNDVELAEMGGDTAGFEAICGSDDKEDAICYEDDFPDVYEEARAVARIVMDGSALCTAWLVSCQNHVMTNNHCTWDDADFDTQGELDRMEFQFIYEDSTCGGGGATVEYSFMSGTWLENDHNLDYTLIQAPAGENPAATYGWLLLDDRLPDIDELMYIVGHPSGRPKEISLYSGHSSEDNPDGFCEVFSVDEPACVGGSIGEVGYFCDTEGGNSGSPVLSRDTNKVIALHHCANCPNRGVRIPNIVDANQAGPNALPACSLFDDVGSVELDRGLYGCADTISIEVFDGSIPGAGTQSVAVWSDSEPTPENITLTESPADSGTFVGSISTTAAPAATDGSLSVIHGDAITVRYIDADDGQGGTNIPRDAGASADCQGPIISGVLATDVAGTTATVVWATDEPADSEVEHGIVPPNWTTTYEADMVTGHSVELSGLNECMVHQFRVRSTDEAGNSATDDNVGLYHSFETGVDVRPTIPYTGLPVPITDNNTVVSVITVGEDFPIQDLDVTIDITHTYTGDLDIFLRAPNGVQVELTTDNGGSGADYSGTTFDDEAPTSITTGSAPFSGSYQPETPLSTLDGISVLGDWELIVTDDAGSDVGTLNAWSITPTYPPRACGPHASYGSHAVEADVCDESGAGHLDSVWDPGEDVTFSIAVTNDGTDPLTVVSATVTALTPGIVMLKDTASYDDIGVSESADSLAPHFEVRLPDALFCGGILDFEIEITANGETWTESFSQTVGTLIPGGGIAFEEDFDAGGIPPSWQVVDGGTTADTWYADDSGDPGGCSNTDPAPPLSGTWAAADSDCAGSGTTMDESLITPLIDLSGVVTAALEFDHYYNAIGSDIADVDVRSSLTGGTWVNVARWTSDTQNAQSEFIDITAEAAGASDVEIRWHYYDANFAWYWYVDNVRVSFTAPGGCEMFPCGLSGAPAAQTGARWMDSSAFTWTPDPFATQGYTVYRGAKNGLASLSSGSQDSCIRFTSSDPNDNVADLGSDNPIFTPGRFYWYLVTGWNPAGEGEAGDGESGPRQVDASGICP